jgi:dihydrodipicolinate synthase/N-acetylneuraminate lyase
VSGRAYAAAVTPLRDGGAALDEEAFGPYVEYLAAGGVHGVLAVGTTGEGILLSRPERQRAAELFLAGPLPVIVHAGAQTTADTVALAEHAAAAGAAGVAVIGPPYFVLDERALLDHFARAAAACAPTPFYVYEFERASGYAVPVKVVERLRERSPNLAGLKVSDAPFEKVQPYLLEGLDVFVGAEALLGEGMAAGAAGGVSGLAAAFPEVVAEAVRTGDSRHAGELRAHLERFPRHAALKLVLQARGVPILDEVRAPLRRLVKREREELLGWLASS